MRTEKVVILTGAAGGIGIATANKFAEKGYKMALCDIDKTGLSILSESLVQKYGTECLLLQGDLSDDFYLESIARKTEEKWGRIDVLVNNAAWRTIETLRTIQINTWGKTLKICLTAPLFLTKWVALVMEQKQTGGVIINVTSIMSERPSGTSPAYIAAKGALESLTRESAITYGRSGIRVVGVAPGFIETELSNDYTSPDGNNISDRIIQEITDYTPLGRGGKSSEVAEAIFWLSSDSASYITGTTILVDGGFKPNFSKYSIKKQQFPDEF
ncbi:SDR family NAD(P)-dependent oxidoreductase [Dyadobacter frigoris]|uniref:SDR family oxidoreductase n=1 Tax=Dyadobacter frigoris TaxID=2576211 RepID=A0A4U6CTR8_9BACT|nr:SDR family oxidoreductase [Dyadobacter frigoris]TKT86987.1 SDR family oxidoreductase [Dyadobacter frigoris]GLU52822.1 oxidoreductase [Dyadobacter frigoris]